MTQLKVKVGRVTMNKVDKALKALRYEAACYDELNNHIDGDGNIKETRTSYMSPFGKDGAQVERSEKLFVEIQEKHGFELRPDNYKAWIEDITQATLKLRETRPVKDSRSSEEELRKRQADVKARAEKRKAEEDAQALRLEAHGITIPAGAMAIMLSEHFDDSDIQTDYFNRHASAKSDGPWCIGIVRKGAQREDTMRSVVEAIPELSDIEWEYKKEEYSGGHGTYLEATKGHRTDDKQHTARQDGGTVIFYEVSCNKYSEGKRILAHPSMVDHFTHQLSSVHPSPSAGTFTTLIGDCEVSRNEEKNGIELRFQKKPAPEVLQWLKTEIKARWHRRLKFWYCRYSEERLGAIRAKLA